MASPPIVRLDEQDVPDAAVTLARAFHDDPFQRYIFPDPAERAQKSPAHFTPILRYGLRFGEVLTTTGRPRGAAVWLGPGAWDVTPERSAAAGLDQLPALMGGDAARRFVSVLSHIEPHHRQFVSAAHWYLFVVGLEPGAQGRGLGRALLQPVIERAAAEGLPCYLETAQPNNVPFYRRLGFEPVVETLEPESGLTLWAFRKDPACARA